MRGLDTVQLLFADAEVGDGDLRDAGSRAALPGQMTSRIFKASTCSHE